MFLVITPLKAFWNHDEERAYLGEWCLFPDHLGIWQKERHKVLAKPWRSVRAYRRSRRYVEIVCDSLLNKLAKIFNEELRRNHSSKYWKILLQTWVQSYISRHFNRYLHLRTATSALRSFQTFVLDPETSLHSVKPTFTADVRELQQYSKLLTAMGYDYPAKSLP